MQVEHPIPFTLDAQVKNPKFSVCVMTYNQEKYIRQCLQSILDQETNFDFEVIVGDDCSTDRTGDIVREFAKNYPKTVKQIAHKKNIGASNNYTSIHSAARGEYISHMDGDDYALPGKLQAMANALDADSSVNIVFHRMRIRSDDLNIEKNDLFSTKNIRQRRFSRADILAIGAIGCHSAKAYRKNVRLTEFPKNEFLDFYIDVEQIGNGVALLHDEVLGVYRSGIGVTSNNTTKNIYTETLHLFLKKYPEYSAEIGGNAITCMLADLKNNRKTWRAFWKIASPSLSLKTIFIFAKWLGIRRFTRNII